VGRAPFIFSYTTTQCTISFGNNVHRSFIFLTTDNDNTTSLFASPRWILRREGWMPRLTPRGLIPTARVGHGRYGTIEGHLPFLNGHVRKETKTKSKNQCHGNNNKTNNNNISFWFSFWFSFWCLFFPVYHQPTIQYIRKITIRTPDESLIEHAAFGNHNIIFIFG